eukprot:m.165146 g.165146  ORF g.165146 m.165146 type:complete len:754 (+) comp14667_c0_seq1:188-2449(+)
MRALLLLCLLAGSAHGLAATESPTGLLPLLEASGAVAGTPWQVVSASPLFCTGSHGGAAVIVVAAGRRIATLVGPTPHTIESGNLSLGSDPVWGSATPTDVDGDGTAELVLVAATREGIGGADLLVVSFNSNCTGWNVTHMVSVPHPTSPSTAWSAATAVSTTVGRVEHSHFDADSSHPAEARPGLGSKGTPVEAAAQKILLLGDQSPQFVLVDATAPGHVVGAADLMGDTDVGWERMAAGCAVDPSGAGTGATGLVITRDAGPTRVALLNFTSLTEVTVLATSALESVAPNTTHWLQPGVGSVFGDGRGTVNLVGTTQSTSTPIVVTLALNGSSTLSIESTHTLDKGGWVSATFSPVLGASVLARPGELQLLGLRSPAAVQATFPVNLLVYGRAEHFLSRRAAVDGTLSQYGFDASMNVTAPLDVNVVKRGLADTHANTYSFIACDTAVGGRASNEGYLAFVNLLSAVSNFSVSGQQVRFWLTVLPPTEAVSSKCQPPPDSPLTPFNETALFDPRLGYLDYAGWALLCGELAVLFPHFVALQVDDMSHDVQPPDGIFTPALVARMSSNLRKHAPWVNLIPTTYYTEGGFVWSLWPDLPKVVDTVLFYFRNQKQGAGPCANPICPWGPRMVTREGGCLAGSCSEATAQNVGGEVADISAGMPSGRPIQVGFYATGHSSLGEPTPRYVRMVMNAILTQGNVAGITFYRMHVPPPTGCGGVVSDTDKGCIVAEIYAGLNDRSGLARATLARRSEL